MKVNRQLILGMSAIAATLVFSCGQDYNSNSGDERLRRSTTTQQSECDTPAKERLCAANKIIANRCLSCHEWPYDTDAEWTGSGLIKAGNKAGSKIISRLKNAGGDMPADGTKLSDSEYKAMVEWVEQIEQ
ncbi:MAG: cytochrome c [Oligoflexales bacterium]